MDCRVEERLESSKSPSASRVREILSRARELKGLAEEDVAQLCGVSDPDLLRECFETAAWVKREIYGNRIVLFAPLYYSNRCSNDCAYCAFRSSNTGMARRSLSREELVRETEALLAQGQKRVLLVAGEAEGARSVFDAVDTVYSVKTAHGGVRRINVNVAPMSREEFRELKTHGIGTYQMFQETYHEPTYRALHPRGPKADYARRRATPGVAFEGGIDDLGMGLLFGLYDWRWELLSLLRHVRELEQRYGLGPHTLSVPRLEPADGSELSRTPPSPVSDTDFKRIVAILRMAVPYTGIILSTRESVEMRRAALELGVSQISAGSCTAPGGYADRADETKGQFLVGDHRTLREIVSDLVRMGFVPSFCTACYRAGRVGKDFMDLAKPGLIKKHCLPNALLTFAEYLEDFGGPSLAAEGWDAIRRLLDAETSLPKEYRTKVHLMLDEVQHGKRDIRV